MNLENKFALVLNNSWVPIGVKNVKDAITSIYENNDWHIVQVDYVDNEPSIQPVSWSEWIELPIPEYCDAIHTQYLSFRVPTIIISKRYKKIHFKKLRPNLEGVYKRDKGICQYTGKKLNKTNSSIDHVLPKSRGGKDTWDNMVLCDKEVNNSKGSKLPDESGLQLISQPKEPKPITDVDMIRTRHRDWEIFLG